MPRSKRISTASPFRPRTIIALLLMAGAFCSFNTRNSTAALPQQEPTPLELGKPITKSLAGGEAHSYRVALSAGQFLRVVIEQRGIDVVVTLFGPDGKQVREVDAPNGEEGPEILAAVAAASGNFRLEIHPSEEKAKAGRYEARLEILREATDADRKLVTAQRLFEEAEELRTQRNEDARRQALQKYEEALKLHRELGNQTETAEVLLSLGTLYSTLNQTPQALDAFNQALPLLRANKDQEGEATALNNLGVIYSNTGQLRQALAAFEQALPLRRAVKDHAGEAITLNGLGETYRRLGEKRKALKYFQQALPLRRAARDTAGEATTLNNIGSTYLDLGEMQKALDIYNQALPLRRDPASRALTLIQIGRAYDLLGVPQEALRYYEQALPITRTANAKRTEANTLNFMGLAHWSAGDYAQAANLFEQALPLSQAVKDTVLEAAIYNNLCLIYTSLREWQKALEAANKGLPLIRQTGNRQYEADLLNNIGFAHEGAGAGEMALQAHQQALALARDVRDVRREAKIRYGIARLESAGGRLKQARSQIEQTIKIVEATRAKLTDQTLRTEYRASTQQYYDLYIDVLMRLHKRQPGQGFSAAALHASERARARSLLEMLSEAGADIRQGAAPELIERERELQEQLNDKTAEQIRLLSSQAKPAQIAALNQEIAQLTSALRETRNQLRTSNPRYAALTQPQPLTAAAIQRQLLTPDTLLLEYALGAERSYLWVLSQTALRSYTLPKRDEIEAAARRYYELLTARNQFIANETRQAKETRVAQADTDLAGAGADLSRLLLGPVASQLRGQRLLIVSDGALQYVPFTALPLLRSGRAGENSAKSPAPLLIVRHEITNLPSASTLAVLRREMANRPAASKSIAVFADPVFESQDERVKKVESKAEKKADSAPTDAARILLIKAAKETGVANVEFRIPRLPYTRNEAEAILALTNAGTSKAAFDFAANRQAVLNDELGQYRVVHFATHGFLNSLNPELSGLVLGLVDEQGAPLNGYLLAPEVYNLKLAATELVVLSACQTGLGKEVTGEGVVGLTRGFMYAGAPRVIVSLWSVSDRATADLMKALYQGMLRQQLRPAAALRAAQLALWKQQQWQAPYYWAAFTLQGEWR